MKCQWRATQTGPQFAARIGLANSAMRKPTVACLREANAIAREIQKSSKDRLILHNFNYQRPKDQKLAWSDLIELAWGDAAQANRPDGASTGGMVIGLTVPEVMEGREVPVSLILWKSWKLDRMILGSNGAESQAIYETEDKAWKVRILWSQIHGVKLNRGEQDLVAAYIRSLLIMDSRGCFDSCTRQESHGLGMKHDKEGIEMLAVRNATQPASKCLPTWVPGDLNLADSMTKEGLEARRIMALYISRKTWVVKFDPEFVSAKRRQKLGRNRDKDLNNTSSAPGPTVEGLDLADLYELEWSHLDSYIRALSGPRQI